MSEQPKCTLRDAELLADVEKWVSKLCDPGGMAWTLSVPVNFNRDPDMLITELHKRYAALLARHNALVEAVAWEREFDEVLVWLVRTGRYPRDMASRYDLANERDCARAEVDRLMGEGGQDG
jgi:hypothetical protein